MLPALGQFIGFFELVDAAGGNLPMSLGAHPSVAYIFDP